MWGWCLAYQGAGYKPYDYGKDEVEKNDEKRLVADGDAVAEFEPQIPHVKLSLESTANSCECVYHVSLMASTEMKLCSQFGKWFRFFRCCCSWMIDDRWYETLRWNGRKKTATTTESERNKKIRLRTWVNSVPPAIIRVWCGFMCVCARNHAVFALGTCSLFNALIHYISEMDMREQCKFHILSASQSRIIFRWFEIVYLCTSSAWTHVVACRTLFGTKADWNTTYFSPMIWQKLKLCLSRIEFNPKLDSNCPGLPKIFSNPVVFPVMHMRVCALAVGLSLPKCTVEWKIKWNLGMVSTTVSANWWRLNVSNLLADSYLWLKFFL